MLETLNLPSYQFSLRRQAGKIQIFDSQRKKFVALTPEEWVRQHFLHFLIAEKGFPAALIAVEQELQIGNVRRRYDAVVFSRQGEAVMLLEFKAPQVALTQAVFDQIAVYNTRLNLSYFIVSNGLQHYCCRTDRENARYEFLTEIPQYDFFVKKTHTH